MRIERSSDLILFTVMSITDNKVLIRQLRDNDQQIFENLYDYYSLPIFKNIYKLLPHQQDAEDILQSVFIQLWENRLKLTEDQSVAGWLFTTSFYMTMSHIRKVAKEQLKELEDSDVHQMITDDTENDTDFYQKRVEVFNQAVQLLPARKKQAFELCKIEGRSYKEAAVVLGISEETVKEYVKSAMSTLRRYVLHTDASVYLFFVLFIS